MTDNGQTSNSARNWTQALQIIATWLAHVKRDYEAPDLWAQVRDAERLASASGNRGENETLTTVERQRLLKETLPELKRLLVQGAATQDSITHIEPLPRESNSHRSASEEKTLSSYCWDMS